MGLEKECQLNLDKRFFHADVKKEENDFQFKLVANKLVTLKNKRDFQKLRINGQRIRLCKWMIVNFCKNECDFFRWGWTIPKKIGNAVVRNRIKRWCRVEAIKFQNDNSNNCADINVVILDEDKIFFKHLSFLEFNENFLKSFSAVQRALNK